MLSVQLVDPLEDTQARPHRTLGVVAVRDGRAEDGHDCVADELLEHATVLFDSPLRLRVVELQRVADVFRIGPIRACCETDEIHEEDGDELPLLTRRARILQRRAAAAAEARPALRSLHRSSGNDERLGRRIPQRETSPDKSPASLGLCQGPLPACDPSLVDRTRPSSVSLRAGSPSSSSRPARPFWPGPPGVRLRRAET